MGCDIHVYIEKKKDGKWVPAEGLIRSSDGTLDVPYPARFYTNRNYDLFGFLTGGEVRRNPGIYLSKPKGLPKDISPEIKRQSEVWGSGAHNHSWLTLKELRSVDWNKAKIIQSGMMDDETWKIIRAEVRKKFPDRRKITNYCQFTNTKGHKSHQWKTPIRVAFEDFYERLNLMHSYDYECKDDEIRMVFWFDN